MEKVNGTKRLLPWELIKGLEDSDYEDDVDLSKTQKVYGIKDKLN